MNMSTQEDEFFHSLNIEMEEEQQIEEMQCLLQDRRSEERQNRPPASLKRRWRARLRKVQRTGFLPDDLLPHVQTLVTHALPLAYRQPYLFPINQLRRLVYFGTALYNADQYHLSDYSWVNELKDHVNYYKERVELREFIMKVADRDNYRKSEKHCGTRGIDIINPIDIGENEDSLRLAEKEKLARLTLFPTEGLVEWFSPFNATNCASEESVDEGSSAALGDDLYREWRNIYTSGGKVILSYQNRENILHGRWVNDMEVSAALVILKKDFPSFEGLYDTIYCPRLAPEWFDKAFVQIFQIEGRWVCMYKPVEGQNNIFLYDCSKDVIERDLKNELKNITLNYKDIKYTFARVQQQEGHHDCGVFAIAFATSLCHGEDPSNRTYEQKQLRQHLVSCLDEGCMKPFP